MNSLIYYLWFRIILALRQGWREIYSHNKEIRL